MTKDYKVKFRVHKRYDMIRLLKASGYRHINTSGFHGYKYFGSNKAYAETALVFKDKMFDYCGKEFECVTRDGRVTIEGWRFDALWGIITDIGDTLDDNAKN